MTSQQGDALRSLRAAALAEELAAGPHADQVFAEIETAAGCPDLPRDQRPRALTAYLATEAGRPHYSRYSRARRQVTVARERYAAALIADEIAPLLAGFARDGQSEPQAFGSALVAAPGLSLVRRQLVDLASHGASVAKLEEGSSGRRSMIAALAADAQRVRPKASSFGAAIAQVLR